ncbi:hypothetical protein [Streptomyces sp. NBC_01304]|uniref:hypothetical protein n=1 Tax=Streptomyces sp. NBC_01304 TaxID=2903818 RepID=UPI002E0EB7D1|nr:hypothetical protein OG430_48240 [Streptomyces sp. NBC_01304]
MSPEPGHGAASAGPKSPANADIGSSVSELQAQASADYAGHTPEREAEARTQFAFARSDRSDHHNH